jgi:flavodoxin
MTAKKLSILGFALILSVSVAFYNAGAQGQSSSTQKQDGDAGNVLIAYFTTSGVVDTSLIDPSIDATSQASVVIPNMELVAGYINETIGGAMFAIKTVKKYPVSFKELNAMGYAERDADARPELSTHVKDMSVYKTVYLCYPNWCGTIPMAVATFMDEYDFSGKTIIASCTQFGSGFGSSVQDIRKLCPNSVVREGFVGSGRNVREAKNDVVKWLNDFRL